MGQNYRMIKSLKKLIFKDREVAKLQDNLEQALNPVLASPIIDGVLIRDICMTPGSSNEVLHRLGRKPIGYLITRKRQDSRIWDLQETNPSPQRTLSLACSHSCQVDVWIF